MCRMPHAPSRACRPSLLLIPINNIYSIYIIADDVCRVTHVPHATCPITCLPSSKEGCADSEVTSREFAVMIHEKDKKRLLMEAYFLDDDILLNRTHSATGFVANRFVANRFLHPCFQRV